jgi:cytochrome bd-type quinol oxidase subunit 2
MYGIQRMTYLDDVLVLLGTALGDILSGVPLNVQGNITVSLIDLLKPYPLLIGVTTVATFAMHGGLYLALNTFVVIATVALRSARSSCRGIG